MAKQSSEMIIEELRKLLISEKDEGNLKTKIEKLISDSEDNLTVPEMITDDFLHFKDNEYNKYPEKFKKLAKGQDPKFMVFACSDSRVSPSHVLNFQIGETFMLRNISNMVPQFNQTQFSSSVGSALEYALRVLKVENILIMGHSKCGGIDRLMNLPDDSTSFDFLDDWVQIGLPAKTKVKEEYGHLPLTQQIIHCEKESVNNSLVNLLSYPYVRNGIEDKSLTLWGGYYDFVNGKFELWELKPEIETPIIIGKSKC